VADVFDALTAMDRPYKKAVPTSRALEILRLEADDYSLNRELVRLFEEQKIYQLIGLGE
jgi:HD-GYP domain-containing protein (c-di-GMP phosphodiesterase class II)